MVGVGTELAGLQLRSKEIDGDFIVGFQARYIYGLGLLQLLWTIHLPLIAILPLINPPPTTILTWLPSSPLALCPTCQAPHLASTSATDQPQQRPFSVVASASVVWSFQGASIWPGT